jgi:hypothetical protein
VNKKSLSKIRLQVIITTQCGLCLFYMLYFFKIFLSSHAVLHAHDSKQYFMIYQILILPNHIIIVKWKVKGFN